MLKGTPLLYQLSGRVAMTTIFAFFVTMVNVTVNRNIFSLIAIIVAIAIIAAVPVAYVIQRRQLRIIEEKGELKTTLTTWAWAIGLAFVLAGLVVLGFSILNVLNYFSTIMVSFFFTYSAAFLVTEMYVIRKWQHKNHREILLDSSWIVGRMYASPPTENLTKS
jgi:branched-subunit amino acid ABC-type transport system permease component